MLVLTWWHYPNLGRPWVVFRAKTAKQGKPNDGNEGREKAQSERKKIALVMGSELMRRRSRTYLTYIYTI